MYSSFIRNKIKQFNLQKTTLSNDTIKYLAYGHLNYDINSKQYLHRNYSISCLIKVSLCQQLFILTGSWDFINKKQYSIKVV